MVLLEELERHVQSDRLVIAIYQAQGAKNLTLPEFQEKKALFDAALVEEPKPVKKLDRDQLALRRALGVK